ncbi:hypothetical protein H632_c1879p0, partial [Helicosporidium sp. ATCC 50920]
MRAAAPHEEDLPPPPPVSRASLWTLPTILTVLRVMCVPLVSGLWFAPWPAAREWCTGLFLFASATDFLDGYLARRMDSTSAFGAFLDPVADKLMVVTVLILLSTASIPGGVAQGNAWLLPLSSC